MLGVFREREGIYSYSAWCYSRMALQLIELDAGSLDELPEGS